MKQNEIMNASEDEKSTESKKTEENPLLLAIPNLNELAENHLFTKSTDKE